MFPFFLVFTDDFWIVAASAADCFIKLVPQIPRLGLGPPLSSSSLLTETDEPLINRHWTCFSIGTTGQVFLNLLIFRGDSHGWRTYMYLTLIVDKNFCSSTAGGELTTESGTIPLLSLKVFQRVNTQLMGAPLLFTINAPSSHIAHKVSSLCSNV